MPAAMRKREDVEPRNNPYSNWTKVFIYWKSKPMYALRWVYIGMAGSKVVAGIRKCLYRNLGEPKCFQWSHRKSIKSVIMW